MTAVYLLEQGDFLPDPDVGGFFMSLAAIIVVLGVLLDLFALLWFLSCLHDVWRGLRRRTHVEIDRDGVRLPIRNLWISWDNVVEVIAAGDVVALRLRDPGRVWPGEWMPIWRRLGRRYADPPDRVQVSVWEVRGALYPAYRAALAFHAESVAGS
ncbi:hypothetical protein CS0771_22670 [Catellatospora sp. IY07-71]|uniref:hypothetical protein n=1 Tax=Catellatospora sp. IY07-71 TaxID=2728827 RepID=UPI001BB44482|nr:hypothetical protein [Catellatospora sp. IY07-71]BCJ72723.1 hypothetical protein CS0771_22670 [Catellatospora sp. IY07-71]